MRRVAVHQVRVVVDELVGEPGKQIEAGYVRVGVGCLELRPELLGLGVERRLVGLAVIDAMADPVQRPGRDESLEMASNRARRRIELAYEGRVVNSVAAVERREQLLGCCLFC